MSETTSTWSTPLHKPESPNVSKGTGGPRPTSTTSAPDMFNKAAPTARNGAGSHPGIGQKMFCDDCNSSPCCC